MKFRILLIFLSYAAISCINYSFPSEALRRPDLSQDSEGDAVSEAGNLVVQLTPTLPPRHMKERVRSTPIVLS